MHITEIIKNDHRTVIYSAVTMAECTAIDLKQEQRAYCKIRGKLGISALEIQRDLENKYGEQALPYRTSARWVSLFKDGRNRIEDEPRPVRPPSTASERDVATVKRSRRCTVHHRRNKRHIRLKFVVGVFCFKRIFLSYGRFVRAGYHIYWLMSKNTSVLKLHQNYWHDSKTKTIGGYERLLEVTKHGCTFLSRAIKKKIKCG